jgi:2,3-bisphosphoglycerate-independent phosphoglycerate mutase
VLVHAITDGRDSQVTDGVKHTRKVAERLKELGFGSIATLSGRYYTMDRDKRWERTKLAYDCIARGQAAEEFDDAEKKLGECYARNETDEFIKPKKARGYGGMKEGDSVIFFNFRTDRPRQLTQAIVEKDFTGWERKPLKVHYVTMTQYYTPMNARAAFKEHLVKNILGEVVAKKGLKQLRISETEKYAHVTFFLNCQQEKPFECEDRVLISSPKVATYDLAPEMSAREVTARLVSEINSKKYDLIIANLVNCDMVGHTGVTEAIIKAVETVDECTGKIADAGLKNDYTLLVLADHGNAEDQTPKWRTSHTINPVPLILASNKKELQKTKLKEGMGLSSIAPTALALLGIPKPEEMTGVSLIQQEKPG